jgi:hypothetical protein
MRSFNNLEKISYVCQPPPTVSVTNGVGVQPLVGMPLGGIALDNAGMELVKLRDNTGRRAVRPSHFISLLVFMASQ